jgi:hypothetical protein
MSIQHSVVAVYRTHMDADQAVKELQRGGVDMHKLSIVGKGYHTDEHAVGYYNAGDRMKYWGKAGAFWGGFWTLIRLCFFHDSRTRTNLGGGTGSCMDRGSGRECCGGRRCERTRRRSLQHGHSDL